MKSWVLVFSFLFACHFLYGQITLQGTIDNETDVEGIHVLNTSSRYNTVTNENGNFSIKVSKVDTLFVSSVKYQPKQVVITQEIFEKEILIITLEELVNELDEVVLGPNLTGNIETDLKKIKTKDAINFDDVGIPGFKGVPEEKIPTVIGQTIGPTHVNIEALYKHLSGYYKKLKTRRKWEAQNQDASKILNFYTHQFFVEAYDIPENRLYDFMLFCIETSTLQKDFKKENYTSVIAIFDKKSKAYNSRLEDLEYKKE
ncbi:carboxypeptidase-like regulatory domain-containing protein [Patiriisocius hiemis]|uniref:Carboxypeptidase-like regulatory domain-containing protein n=1 Tax=Patiriisocius hiemis TaxID=3075604 RepID=A0ABU2YH12_9FLAO|nr:carboxypeptidase-like regulatory domain-containing protein [Constantimarinum sp. W242]MDT0556540.1 carboxypeptidase-like regulatory domain-containing protein [Constantimarinum sp. W242]